MGEDRGGAAGRIVPGATYAGPIPPPTGRTAVSLRHCHHVARTRARNFYYGLRLTPEPKRSALYTIYAFMRACDDLVDEPAAPDPQGGNADALARVAEFRAKMVRTLESPVLDPAEPAEGVWPAFRYVTHHFSVDPAHLHGMLDGQRADLTVHRYQRFDELYRYCYNVAGVVGLVCVDIWGTDGRPGVHKLAEYRGVALQLTNILRDLVEDANRGRVYLPAEDLERFGYAPEGFVKGMADGAFDRLMEFQIERARSYYQMSAELEGHIDPRCRATSWAIHRIYRGLLDKIAADPWKVLTGRVRLSSFQKARIALAAAWKRGI